MNREEKRNDEGGTHQDILAQFACLAMSRGSKRTHFGTNREILGCFMFQILPVTTPSYTAGLLCTACLSGFRPCADGVMHMKKLLSKPDPAMHQESHLLLPARTGIHAHYDH